MRIVLRIIAVLLVCLSQTRWIISVQATGDPVLAAVTYLQTHAAESPEWAALALRAAGQPAEGIPINTSTEGDATDLARRILALAAVGNDPRPLADALERHVLNGSVNGDLYLNDDVFALLALRAAGRAVDAEPIPTIAAFLVNAQSADGGWGVTTLSRSDVDSTAAALQALASVDVSGETVHRGTDYIRAQQNADGGLPFRLPFPTNSASTSWAISSLSILGVDPATWDVNDATPLTALQTFQQPDGGFGWQMSDPTSTVLLTSYAVLALTGRGFIVATYVPPSDPPTDPPPNDEPPPAAEPPGDDDQQPEEPPSNTLPPATDGAPSETDRPTAEEDRQTTHAEPKQKKNVTKRVKRSRNAPNTKALPPATPSNALPAVPETVSDSSPQQKPTRDAHILSSPVVSQPNREPPSPQIAGIMDEQQRRTPEHHAVVSPVPRSHIPAMWIMTGIAVLLGVLGDLFLSYSRRRPSP